MDLELIYKRRRSVISCAECHRRKRKCDRVSPCSNCVKRGKQSVCFYKTVGSSSYNKGSKPTIPRATLELRNLQQEPESDTTGQQDHSQLIQEFGYATHSNQNTLTVLEKIDTYPNDGPISADTVETNHDISAEVNKKYMDLTRQLPPKSYINIMVQFFFKDVNWQYYVIDEIEFRQQMDTWEQIPYAALSRGLFGLDAQTRAFPALVFQVLAQALLYQPACPDERLESLKYAASMTLLDLAVEFSECGAAILSILGKKDVTMATVQAGLLRASFLKSSGCVIEAWHMLGLAIRDAQEIGLHRSDIAADRTASLTLSTEVQSRDKIELRPRVWLVLHIWDLHMAVVLGRPIATHLRPITFPISSEWLRNGPPTALTVILVGYQAAYRFFAVIRELEDNSARLEQYSTVQEVHSTIVGNIQSLPSWCQFQNPTLEFDTIPECVWLPAARQGLSSLVHFVLLALHRPYVFSVVRSRVQALEAALAILKAQSQLFQMLGSQHHMTFNLVYASFDAMVLIVAIYLLYPTENGEYLEQSLQCLQWGLETLAIVGKDNKMASSAHGVVEGLYHRLKQRLASLCSTASQAVPNKSANSSGKSNSGSLPMDDLGGNYLMNALSSNTNFSTVAPPQPIHDLFYQDLAVIETAVANTPVQHQFTATDLPLEDFIFSGTYSNDSFWNFVDCDL